MRRTFSVSAASRTVSATTAKRPASWPGHHTGACPLLCTVHRFRTHPTDHTKSTTTAPRHWPPPTLAYDLDHTARDPAPAAADGGLRSGPIRSSRGRGGPWRQLTSPDKVIGGGGRVVKSLFILWITVPRSSVRPSLTRAWWLSATGYVAALEPPPGRGGRQWLGSLPRHSAGVGIPKSHCQVTRSTAILAHSIPSPSSHGSAMARTGRKSLIPRKALKKGEL